MENTAIYYSNIFPNIIPICKKCRNLIRKYKYRGYINACKITQIKAMYLFYLCNVTESSIVVPDFIRYWLMA